MTKFIKAKHFVLLGLISFLMVTVGYKLPSWQRHCDWLGII